MPGNDRSDSADSAAARSRLTVAVDTAALQDGRASAGIGRYVLGLMAALEGVGDLEVVTCRPRRRPRPDAWGARFLNAQPAQFAVRIGRDGVKPAVFHATSTDPSGVWPPGAQVVTVHDVMAWKESAGPGPRSWLTSAYFGLQRRRFRRCGAIIAVSETTAREAIALFRLDPSRVHVIGEGVGAGFTMDRHPDDERLRAAAGVELTGYVAWVGSLRAHDPRKALTMLLRAVAAVVPRPPLVLVGECGPEAVRLKALAEQAHIDLRLTGFVSDATLSAIYRGAGVVAIASTHEGFGLPMLEAMACGAPVVATDVANLAHLGRGGAAVLVPSGNARAFGDGLARVLSDHALTARLRAAGPARAGEHSWTETARRTADVYREVSARRSR